MRKILRGWIGSTVVAGGIVVQSAVALAIETTYGEDPVPNSHCYDGFIDLGYGIDPIPAETLPQRWQAWRRGRGKAPQDSNLGRQVAIPPRAASRQATEPRPSSRRAYQPQPMPRRR